MRTRKTTGFASAEQAALVTQLGRESRSNPDHFQASAFSFVLDEALKLKKAPVAYPIVHSLSKPSSSYSFEVFHHYFVSFKSGNNLFAYVVVNPSHEPLLSATQLPKKPLGGASAFGLKNRTQMLKLSFDLFDFGRVVEPAFASDSEVVNSEVNAKNTFLRSVASGINFFRKSEQKISPSLPVNSKQALSQLPTFEVFRVTGRNFDAEFLSAFEQPQSENISFETGGTGEVVSDKSPLNYRLAFGFLNNSTRLLDTSHSKLCWQDLPQPLINEWVQPNIISDSTIPSLVNAELQSLPVSLNSSNHLIGSNDFNLSNSTPNHTQQQKNTTINTLAGHLSSVQCFFRKVFGNITTQSPQAAEYQRK